MDDRDRTIVEMNAEMERLGKRIAELESRAAGDRLAEEELRETLLRQAAILNNIPDIAWLKDRESRFIAVNGPFGEACGVSPANLVGMTDYNIWPRDLAESYRADDAEVMRSGRRKRVEERLVGPDRRERWIETIKTPILDAQGQVIGTTGIARDITERKQAEEKLRNVTRLYAFLSQINQATVRTREPDELFRAICRVATESGQFRMAWVGLNDEAGGIVRPVTHAGREEGYLKLLSICVGDEVTGKGPTGSAHREGALSICDDIATDPRMLPWREEALKRGYRSSAAIPFVMEGKVIGSLNLYASEPGFFTDAERKLLEGIGVDISHALDGMEREKERLRAEEALRESRERYRSFFENAAVAVAIVDQDGYVVEANDTDCRFLGYPHSELIGMHFTRFTHPRDIESDAGLYRSLLGGQRQGYEIEKRYIRKDGEVVWGRLAVSLIRDSQGLPVYTSVVCYDITERKRIEEALRESEERFRFAMEATRDGLWDWDVVSGQVYYSPSYFLMLGLHPGQYPANLRTWVDLIHPDDRERAWNANVACIEGAVASFEVEFRMKHRDGFWRWILGRGKSIARDVTGRAVRLIGTHTDITERKQTEQERLDLERQLLHSQKLESLGVLAGGIAHDFNNLLMAVLGNLDLALRKLSPVSPARGNIEQSAQAARRATDLTRQMLAYSGRGRFMMKAIDLSELVEENAHLFRSSVARTTILDLRMERTLPPIEADQGQVQQVIMNLITNAAEAIGGSAGRITITTGVRDCDAGCLKRNRIEAAPPAGRFVMLEVSDTGCGMDEQTQQRLFDPFFTTKATGRGLGMSAILGIVRGHGGALFVESAVEKGSTIQVLFPALEGAQAEKEGTVCGHAQETTTPALSGTVLIVDDEEIVRNVCKEMVESLGLQVLTAVDGRDGVDLFRKHADEIDLVLLDFSMPNMDGMTAFEELVRVRPGVKVILCSGFDEQGSSQRLSGKGLAAFIQKPYNLKNLRDALEQAGMHGE